jgi:Ca2+-binding EF-hand superfamily protein
MDDDEDGGGSWSGGLRDSHAEPAAKASPLTAEEALALRTKLQSKLKAASYTANGPDVEALFRRMDKDGSGELDAEELAKVLRPLGVTAIEDVLSLMGHIDVDGDGTVNVSELMSFLGSGTGTPRCARRRLSVLDQQEDAAARLKQMTVESPAHGGDWSGGLRDSHADRKVRATPLTEEEALALRTKLQSKLKAASYTANGPDVEALFRRMDKDGSGTLDAEELAKVLRPLGVTAIEDVLSLMGHIDVDGDGTVNVSEMMQFLGSEVESPRRRRRLSVMETAGGSAQGSAAGTSKPEQDEQSTGAGGSWSGGLRDSHADRKVRATPLTEEEALALRTKLQSKLKAASYTAHGTDVEAMFQRFDKDGSGELNVEELAKALRPLGVTAIEDVLSLMGHIDVDGDGTANVSEMMLFLGAQSVTAPRRTRRRPSSSSGTRGGSGGNGAAAGGSADGGPLRAELGRGTGEFGARTAEPGPLAPEEAEALRAKLQSKLKAASYTANGPDVEAMFRRFDKDGSGELDEAELRKVLRLTAL